MGWDKFQQQRTTTKWNHHGSSGNSGGGYFSQSKSILYQLFKHFYMDTRSMALLRVLMSFILLIDLKRRATEASLHYSTWGEYPVQLSLIESRFSLYNFNQSTIFVLVMMTLNAITVISMLIGYKTRLSTFLSYILLTSVQNRNYFLLDGSDDYTRCMLIWCIFLPWGNQYSIDSILLKLSNNKLNHQNNLNSLSIVEIIIDDNNNNNNNNNIDNNNNNNNNDTTIQKQQQQKQKQQQQYQYVSIATVGFLVQFTCIYLFTAILKDGVEWHVTYDSVYYAVSLKEFSHGISAFLIQFPNFMRFLSRFTLIFEYVGPILMVCPLFNSFFRMVSILGFIGMHIGFGICLNLFLFIFIPIVCVAAMLPSIFWDIVFKYLNSKNNNDRHSLKIYYDNAQKGTEFSLNCFKEFFLLPQTPIISYGGTTTTTTTTTTLSSIAQQNKNSYYVELQGDKYYEYDAFIVLCSQSPLLWPLERLLNNRLSERILSKLLLSFIFIIKLIGIDFNKVKEKELIDGSSSSSTTTTTTTTTINQKTNNNNNNIYEWLLILFSLWLLIFTPLVNILKMQKTAIPFHPLVIFVGIDQNWSMFAPNPPKYSNWMAVDASFQHQEEYDFFNDRDFKDYKENPIYPFVTTQRQRNFMMGVLYQEELRLSFGRYQCRKYNIYEPSKELGRLKSFKIHAIQHTTPSLGSDIQNEFRTQMIWAHTC
ncbi:hypothetical protein DFA_11039 [Cavenderia fasciculata]|uniref:HTTM-like domain-containing protein n=1 Tax=Cavenderia fasciculata TaxID=261658 RepID=F4QEG5_CACFS|nr:uncharacterized protein DFA_11039 [Cavenderia fasciculata]EGG13278.1 hypothetical protein DFA_11039 [Cavenderia fasciculata]|eukprot:XP_004349977.1 hypothetical protein DFA_11039 [Cavenderia fasciculata]